MVKASLVPLNSLNGSFIFPNSFLLSTKKWLPFYLWTPVSYVYKLKNYAFLSVALIVGCLYIGFQYEHFAMGGYYVAACLAVFSFFNRIIGEVKFSFAKKAANSTKLNETVRA